jgi:hypothetical protein
MIRSPVGLGTKYYCAGEGQQQFNSQAISQLPPDKIGMICLAKPGLTEELYLL